MKPAASAEAELGKLKYLFLAVVACIAWGIWSILPSNTDKVLTDASTAEFCEASTFAQLRNISFWVLATSDGDALLEADKTALIAGMNRIRNCLAKMCGGPKAGQSAIESAVQCMYELKDACPWLLTRTE